MRARKARRAGRACPKCGEGMRRLQVDRAELDLCPRCWGTWYDTEELSRAAGLRIGETMTAAALAGARRTDHRCPSCGALLYEREIERGAGLLIDQCPRCSGLFLDRDEFSRIKEHFRSRRAPSLPQRSAPGRRADDLPATLDEESSLLALFQYLTGLPLEIDSPQTLFPPVVTTLIVANVAILAAALYLGMAQWVQMLGTVPAEVAAGHRLHTLVTSTFMHAGVLHLVGNMYFLYVAGDNVEGRLGSGGFLAFYLACGLAGGLAQVASDPTSRIPMVGASGAISGVLGAYVVFYPRNRLLVRWLWRIGWVFTPIRFEVPAWAYLGFWALIQLFFAWMDVPGVGWWAHLGGFACGALIAALLRCRDSGKAKLAQPAT